MATLFDEIMNQTALITPLLDVPASVGAGRVAPKDLGAFYTDTDVARFLVWWAIREAEALVIDPSFGGGVFLDAACERLLALGGHPAQRVFGVEIDRETYCSVTTSLRERYGIASENLILSDFFFLNPSQLPRLDAVVGNPPFIRYQRFNGESRKHALRRASDHGVKLSELSSSWLPFLVHSIGLLTTGGRLAMVIPAEIAHAAYARPILNHLAANFAEVSFLTFRKKLFRDLSQDRLLLLADEKSSERPCKFKWLDLNSSSDLQHYIIEGNYSLSGTDLATDRMSSGADRLIEYAIPNKARDLYRELMACPQVRRLGSIADVGIGYVTGANDFFHLSEEAVDQWQIPHEFLRPAVRRGRSLNGLIYSETDWREGMGHGESGYLLRILPGQELPKEVRGYIEHGVNDGVPNSFKCRNRNPWYCVPHVHRPNAFLSYMSGGQPRLVSNHADAVAPNSLHVLRIFDSHATSSEAICVGWQTSLTALSAELEGHSMGGGMLKLEPSEAESVMVCLPDIPRDLYVDLATSYDEISRCRASDIQGIADRELLMSRLGLSAADCTLLSDAAHELRQRRCGRNGA